MSYTYGGELVLNISLRLQKIRVQLAYPIFQVILLPNVIIYSERVEEVVLGVLVVICWSEFQDRVGWP